jgi:hypothetical protein
MRHWFSLRSASARDTHPMRTAKNGDGGRILLIILVLFVPATILAQVGGEGVIQGTVTDASGAAISGATITAQNVATGTKAVRETTGAGFYVISPFLRVPTRSLSLLRDSELSGRKIYW